MSLKQYTNELTADVLAELDKSPFTEEALADMPDDALAIIREQEEFCRQHPIVAIWRHATTGSLTRNGGVVSSASSGSEVADSTGEMAEMAMVGDEVTYQDGTTARIVSGSGSAFSCHGKGYALVGSQLDNGDEIISTPQRTALLCCREGESMPADFLVVPECKP